MFSKFNSVVLILVVALCMAAGNVTAANIQAHWELDGNMLDISGNGNDGTIYNGAESYIAGPTARPGDQAFNFDPANVIDVGGDDSLFTGLRDTGQVTVATWWKYSGDQAGAWESVFKTLNSSTSMVFGLMANLGPAFAPGNTLFEIRDDNGQYAVVYIEQPELYDGDWHHLAWVMTGPVPADWVVYVDGAPVPTIIKNDGRPTTFSSIQYSFTLGAMNNRGSIWLEWSGHDVTFDGALSDFQLWAGPLSQDEILKDIANGVVGKSTGDTIVSELNETSDTFDVVLTRAPDDSEVTVIVGADPNLVDPNFPLYSGDVALTPPGGVSAGPGNAITLTFTSGDWNIPQTVTVTAVDNAIEEGSRNVPIVFEVSGGGPSVDGGLIANQEVLIIDDESAGVVVSPTDPITVSEWGPSSEELTVVLASPPSSEVSIALEDVAEPNQVNINPALLTFNSENWDVAQTVTVTAVDDDVLETDVHVTNIAYTIVIAPEEYSSIVIDNSLVKVLENDCGAWGISPLDVNGDCVVDVQDFAEMALEWLGCTRPNDPECTNKS